MPETIEINSSSIDKIIKNGVSPEEAKAILKKLEKITEPMPEGLEEIKNRLKQIKNESEKLDDNITLSLKNLLISVEDNSREIQNEVLKQNVSMESLKKNTSSDIMKKVLATSIIGKLGNSLTPETIEKLKNTNNEGVFDLFIAQKLLKEGLEKYPSLIVHQENLKLIMFKRVLEKIGTSSIFETLIEKGASSFFGNKKEGEKNDSEFDLTNIKQVFDDIQNFDSSSIDPTASDNFTIYNITEDNKKVETNVQVPKSLILLSEYIEKIVDNDFKNLKKLLQIAKEKNLLEDENFNALLDNPEVMDDLLENGKTAKMGYKIDLSNNIKLLDLNLEDEIDINKVKNDFMDKMIKLTDSTGQPIDELTKGVRNIANIIEKFTGHDIKELKQMLDKFAGEHPFIGGILKFLFGMVFNEGMIAELDNLDFTIKKSIESLNKFKTETTDKSKLPFITEEKLEDKEKQKEVETNKVKNIEKFLKNIQATESIEQVEGEDKKTSIINDTTFWKDVLISKESNNFLIKQVQETIKSIKNNKANINENEFFKKLSKVNFKKEEKKQTPHIVPPVNNTKKSITGETVVASIPVIVQPKKEPKKPEPTLEKPKITPTQPIAITENKTNTEIEEETATFDTDKKEIKIGENYYGINSINYNKIPLGLELNNIDGNNVEFKVSSYTTRGLLIAQGIQVINDKVSFNIPEQDYSEIIAGLKENQKHTYEKDGLEIKFG